MGIQSITVSEGDFWPSSNKRPLFNPWIKPSEKSSTEENKLGSTVAIKELISICFLWKLRFLVDTMLNEISQRQKDINVSNINENDK